jgi:hypothetical protein
MKRAVLPVLVAAAMAAGCTSNTGGSGERSNTPTPTKKPEQLTATVVLAGQKVTAKLPPGAHFGPARSQNLGGTCTVAAVDIQDQQGDGIAFVQLAPTGCERNGEQAINGFLGMFATADDLARQSGVQQRTVSAGRLATFNERYTECTNSCKNFDLDVAVIFLARPANPQRPAINIIDTTDLDGTDNSGYSVADIAASLVSS